MKTGVFCRLLGLVLVLSGCMQTSNVPRVSKIEDLKRSNATVWPLQYDYKGRLIMYGHTSIEYGENEIRIGRMDWDYRGEQLLSAAYFFSEGEVFRSEAHCLLFTDTVRTEVWKEVDYQLCGDTVKMESTYLSIPDRHPLKQIYAQYVYDKDGNLGEIISRYVGTNHETTACHSYYFYDHHISCRSNLNMQSFFIDVEGPDAFFFFLLDMDRKTKGHKLPNRIRYCVNHGKAVYTADGLYQMDGDEMIRGEIISDEVRVRVRMGFEYFTN